MVNEIKKIKKKDSERNFYLIPASIFKRFFALLIDLFILNTFIIGSFSSIFESVTDSSNFASTYGSLMSNPGLRASLTGILFIISILIVTYYVVLQRKFGQTIGMMVMNIFVVKLPKVSDNTLTSKSFSSRKNSRKIKMEKSEFNTFNLSFFDVVLRNLFVIPFAPFIFLWLIDPIYLLFSKTSQRFMEVLSRTITVEVFDYDKTIKGQTQRWF